MRQVLLHNATAILLQNATEIHYKMRQFYYKMRQLLQNATILLQNATFITNCDSTPTVKSWIERIPELVVRGYKLEDICNMDELGLFFLSLFLIRP